MGEGGSRIHTGSRTTTHANVVGRAATSLVAVLVLGSFSASIVVVVLSHARKFMCVAVLMTSVHLITINLALFHVHVAFLIVVTANISRYGVNRNAAL